MHERGPRATPDEDRHVLGGAEDLHAVDGALEPRPASDERRGRERWSRRIERGGSRRVEPCADRRGIPAERCRTARPIRDDRDLLGVEPPSRRRRHLRGIDGEERPVVRHAALPVALQLPRAEEVRLALRRLEAPQRLRFDDAPRAVNLRLGDLAGTNAPQLIPDGGGGVRHPGAGRARVHDEDAEFGRRVVVGGDTRRQAAVPHGAREPRRAPTSEHRREDVERGGGGIEQRSRAPPEHELRLRDVPFPLTDAHPRRRDLGRTQRPTDVGARKRAVVPRRQLDRLVGIDIPDDGEHGIRRSIEPPVEREQLVAREGAEPRLAPHPPPSDAVPVVQHLEERLNGERGGRVRLPLRLLDDHLELARELVGVDDRVGEGIGLHREP